jgi:hypothetical protein
MEAATVSPEQVQELCLNIFAKGPDISSCDTWRDNDRPFGLLIVFSSGARLWTAITTADSTSSAMADTTPRAAGEPLPHLYNSKGLITLGSAEDYFTAVLIDAQAPEMTGAYSYSHRAAQAQCPGVGLLLAGGARAYLPFAFTASASSQPGGRAFRRLHAAF